MTAKFLAIFSLFALVVFPLTAKAQEAVHKDAAIREMLDEAMRNSREMAFSCSINEAKILRQFRASSGEYCQLTTQSGVGLRKMTFFNAKGGVLCILLKAQDGYYGYAAGEWVRMADIHLLWHYDNIWEPLSPVEASLVTFSTQKGENPTQVSIVAETVRDPCLLELPGLKTSPILKPEEVYDPDKELHSAKFAYRPFSRTFTLDTERGFILSRRHYDLNGKLLYNRFVKKVDFNPDITEKDFCPGKVKRKQTLCRMTVFMRLYRVNLQTMNQQGKEPSVATLAKNAIRRLFTFRNLTWFFFGLAILSFGFLFYLKRKG